MAESSVEYNTLRKKYTHICECIPDSDLVKFAGELFQCNLISDAGHRAAIATTALSPLDKVHHLVFEAMTAVKNSRENFNNFVSVLKSRNDELATTLRNDYHLFASKPQKFGAGIRRPTSDSVALQDDFVSKANNQADDQAGKPQLMPHNQAMWQKWKISQSACTTPRLTRYSTATVDPTHETNLKPQADGTPIDPVVTLLSPPGKPYATSLGYESIQISWQKPEYDGIQYYCICYQNHGDPPNKWSTIMTENDENSYNFSANSEKQYIFKVFAATATVPSSVSEVSEPIKTLVKPWGARLLGICKIVSPNPCVYYLPLHYTMKKNGIKIAAVGDNNFPVNSGVPHKVLMLVGATGAAKSTLINGMANYIMGVDWEDHYRFKLIPEETACNQTKCITAYTFHKDRGSPLPYTLTVIDTLEFGNTGELERDKQSVSQIKDFFSIRGDEGIDQLHGIGFVTQAPLARLTQTQRYVFDSILSVFGKDVADNVFLMVTFANVERPPVLDAARAAGVPFSSHFKFNNSALLASNHADIEFDEMFWKMDKASFEKFFCHFLEQKQDVLQPVQQHKELGMQSGEFCELQQERQFVKDNEADCTIGDKDLTSGVEITKQHLADVSQHMHKTIPQKKQSAIHSYIINFLMIFLQLFPLYAFLYMKRK